MLRVRRDLNPHSHPDDSPVSSLPPHLVTGSFSLTQICLRLAWFLSARSRIGESAGVRQDDYDSVPRSFERQSTVVGDPEDLWSVGSRQEVG